MSPKLPPLKCGEIVALLRRHGFEQVSQRGSHAKFKRASDGRETIVPMHPSSEVDRGLLRKILRDAGIDPDLLRNG